MENNSHTHTRMRERVMRLIRALTVRLFTYRASTRSFWRHVVDLINVGFTEVVPYAVLATDLDLYCILSDRQERRTSHSRVPETNEYLAQLEV